VTKHQQHQQETEPPAEEVEEASAAEEDAVDVAADAVDEAADAEVVMRTSGFPLPSSDAW
jgi:hypothetical protein